MPDIKPSLKLTEPLVEEMDYEDDEDLPAPATVPAPTTEPREDKRDVKIQRTVEMKEDPESPAGSDSDQGDTGKEPSQKESPKEKESPGEKKSPKGKSHTKKQEISVTTEVKQEGGEETTVKTITISKKQPREDQKLIRRIAVRPQPSLVKPDEPEKARRSPSPARNPEGKIVHLRNMVRPFTLGQLKELLRRTGPIVEEVFWIDRIKSHCFVTYENVEDAVATRSALHNTRWPSSNPKTLAADFGSEEQVQFHKDKEHPGAKLRRAPEVKKGKESEKMEEARLEREKEIERRKAEREKRMKERLEKEARVRQKPIREWDREKLEKQDWDRTKVRSRSRSPHGRRSSSRSRERRRQPSKEGIRKEKREKNTEKKEDELLPAKLLDDLFKKTKATPSIYWLPLTEVQVLENEKNPKPRRKMDMDRENSPDRRWAAHNPPRDRRDDGSNDRLRERLMRLSDEQPRRPNRGRDTERDRRR